MKNVRIAFKIFEGEVKDIPIGYQKVDCHMIFDIKMGEGNRHVLFDEITDHRSDES